MDFESVQKDVIAFRDERDWRQFHNPKDLALSISIEAAELLECFQWSGADTTAIDKEASIKEELADVLIYCIYLADVMGTNVPSLMEEKLRVNRHKYPVSKSKGSSKKYTEL
ncbi:nucleotide pyrophosphohydrolase [Atopobiaceae bacterium SGI.236]